MRGNAYCVDPNGCCKLNWLSSWDYASRAKRSMSGIFIYRRAVRPRRRRQHGRRAGRLVRPRHPWRRSHLGGALAAAAGDAGRDRRSDRDRAAVVLAERHRRHLRVVDPVTARSPSSPAPAIAWRLLTATACAMLGLRSALCSGKAGKRAADGERAVKFMAGRRAGARLGGAVRNEHARGKAAAGDG